MSEGNKFVFKLIIVWCLLGSLSIFISSNDKREGDSGIKGYPQEFYDTTK